jgi:uncharacterized protein (TIGR03435 family)
VALLLTALHLLLSIQASQEPNPLLFDAASVKGPVAEVRPAFHCHGVDRPDTTPPVGIGRCQGNATLRGLITEAFELPTLNQTLQLMNGATMRVVGPSEKYWIENVPSWIDSQRYSIEAEAGTAATQAELQQMLLSLLKDRFKFAFHRESRPVDGFALVVGKSGSKLSPSTGHEDNPGLHGEVQPGGGFEVAWSGVNVPIAELARHLVPVVGTPVADLTDLKGNYNFTLLPFVGPRAINPGDGPSLFTVIQELGLRLESRKVAVDVIVIDHAEKPAENYW